MKLDLAMRWSAFVLTFDGQPLPRIRQALELPQALLRAADPLGLRRPALVVIDSRDTAFHLFVGDREVLLWTADGQHALARVRTRRFGERTQARLARAMADWHEGLVRCAECGTRVRLAANAHRAFSGFTYCRVCWTRTAEEGGE